MAGEIVQRVAAKAILVNKGRVLILREADTYEEGTNVGRYQLPGGRVDPGESFFDALNREIEEETGIKKYKIIRPFYVGEWHPVIKGIKTQIIGLYIICKTEQTNVRLSQDHDSYEWLRKTDVGKYDLMSPTDEVIRKYFEDR